MQGSNGFALSWRSVRRRALPLVGGVVVSLVAVAPASATLRVENFNDPVGDRTAMSYSISGGNLPAPIVFSLPVGEGIHATSRATARRPRTLRHPVDAGRRLAGRRHPVLHSNVSPNVFTIDVPNGRVTVNHSGTADDTCTFTNRRIGAAATGGEAAPRHRAHAARVRDGRGRAPEGRRRPARRDRASVRERDGPRVATVRHQGSAPARQACRRVGAPRALRRHPRRAGDHQPVGAPGPRPVEPAGPAHAAYQRLARRWEGRTGLPLRRSRQGPLGLRGRHRRAGAAQRDGDGTRLPGVPDVRAVSLRG